MEAKSIFKSLLLAVVGGLVAVGGTKLLYQDKNVEEKIVFQELPIVQTTFPKNPGMTMDFTEAAEGTLNSVVHITTETNPKTSSSDDEFFELFFGRRSSRTPQMSTGSGVIISNDGYIVTNNHVINGADKVTITLNNNKEYEASVIGTDPATDLAVIKIEETGLSEIALGNSDNVQVGEWVLAVGNPFNLTSTVTAGIVSAKARSINIMQPDVKNNVFPIESFIQTDAAVNPGNSGGALVNAQGELVGINTAIASRTGSFSGYSFAVPVNIMKKVTTDIIKYGLVQRAYIGVSIQEMNQELADKLEIKNTEGVYVNGLSEGGAAESAGIKEGDIIVKVQDVIVKSVPALQEQIGKFKPGDKVNIGLYRDGTYRTYNVLLKNIEGNTKVVKKPKEVTINSLGAKLKAISKEEKNDLGIKNGVKVESISSGKLSEFGIEKGFIITKINDESIISPKDVEDKLDSVSGTINIQGVYPNGMRAYYSISK